ncbi:MAG: hypothetical protein ACLFUB_15885, partial [Cyclobacteriaceae bacterium]
MCVKQNFDECYSQIFGLSWYPWVGTNYNLHGTMIMGESLYDDNHEWIDGNHDAVRILVESRISGKHSHLFSKTEQVFYNKQLVLPEESAKMWNSVIYWNLVQRLLASRNDRLTLEEKTDGWRIFFEISDILKPSKCIVLGQHHGQLGNYLNNCQNSWQYNKAEFYTENKIVNLSRNKESLRIIFINHPSGSHGFQWEKWGKLV